MTLEQMIKSTWPAPGPWNTGYAAMHMLEHGYIPTPPSLSPAQLQLFATTHELMCQARNELLHELAYAGLELPTWKLLLRGGVCHRLIWAPGENVDTKLLNALRGERKVWPSRRKQILWEQLSYPAGLVDATLVLLDKIMSVDAGFDLGPYAATLREVQPTVRRTKKASQERRRGN